LSAYETLEQGALAHGFDESTIEQIIEEIKKAVKEHEEQEEKRLSGKKR
jgi:hypothetical protein